MLKIDKNINFGGWIPFSPISKKRKVLKTYISFSFKAYTFVLLHP